MIEILSTYLGRKTHERHDPDSDMRRQAVAAARARIARARIAPAVIAGASTSLAGWIRERIGGSAIGTTMVIALAGCGSTPPPTDLPSVGPDLSASYSVVAPTQCVPFARNVSGIEIYGDAWTWWQAADGEYQRGRQPEVGSVLVLRRTDRLRYGHLAVVVDVAGPREIRVSHANWGWNRQTRNRAYHSMPVVDVSQDNDWSELRFFNPESGAFGRIYPSHGFIYPDRA